jgi:cytidine deaminase
MFPVRCNGARIKIDWSIKFRMMTPVLMRRIGWPVKLRGMVVSAPECLMVTEDELFERAGEARRHAYARYSRFRVGAAIEDERGVIHVGCNVENAAYPVGTCAEAGAISAMRVAGGKKIRRIAVVGGLADGSATVFCAPCGACRQRIAEFADASTQILLRDGLGTVRRFELSNLLPLAFGAEDVLPPSSPPG